MAAVFEFNSEVSVGKTTGHIDDGNDFLIVFTEVSVGHTLNELLFAGFQAFAFDFSHK